MSTESIGMKRRPWLLLATGGALVALLVLSMAFAAGEDRDKDKDRVSLDRVPAKVKAVLQREAAGGKIGEIEREKEEGEVRYEAEVTLNGKRYEIEVTEEGVLVEKELDAEEEQEEEVSMEVLPKAVLATITREASGGKVEEVEKKVHIVWTYYEVDFKLDGRDYEMLVASDGTLIKKKLEREEEEEEEHEGRERYEEGEEEEEHEGYEEHEEHEEHGEREEHEGRGGRENARSMSWGFDSDAPGGVPAGWYVDETAGTGHPAAWQVVADPSAPSAPNAVAITKNENYGHTFNLALVKGSSFTDVDVTVQVKAIAGKEDQGGGVVWRAADANNYYITRWNPLENNFRVYYVKDGRRRQLASARVKLDTSKWHTVRAVMRGKHIDCFLDGRKLLSVDDDTFTKAGMIGLWVKADGKTLFDQLQAGAPGA